MGTSLTNNRLRIFAFFGLVVLVTSSLVSVRWWGALHQSQALHLDAKGRTPVEERLEPAKSAPAPLEGRSKLVKSLESETIWESIDNLPAFNDTVWVMGTINGGTLTVEGSYRHSVQFIHRLNRVRKIISETASDNRSQVIAKLVDGLKGSCNQFDLVFNEHRAKLLRPGGLTLSEPDEYYRRTVIAPTAAYLLAEFRAFDSLPTMSQLYFQEGRLPVARLYLYYAMHLLATEHPRSNLAPGANQALDAYLSAAKEIPLSTTMELPSWNAAFEESDFRFDRRLEAIDLGKEPKITLRVYPSALGNREDFGGKQTDEIDRLTEKIRAFVAEAYPN